MLRKAQKCGWLTLELMSYNISTNTHPFGIALKNFLSKSSNPVAPVMATGIACPPHSRHPQKQNANSREVEQQCDIWHYFQNLLAFLAPVFRIQLSLYQSTSTRKFASVASRKDFVFQMQQECCTMVVKIGGVKKDKQKISFDTVYLIVEFQRGIFREKY